MLGRDHITKTLRMLITGLGLLLLFPAPAAAAQLQAIRVAVKQDHTRVVIESSAQIRFSLFVLRNPERAILDIDGLEATQTSLQELASKIGSHHPYLLPPRISRTGEQQFRIEFPFRVDTDPRITTLAPGGNFGFRLVLDIYPDLPATTAQSAAAPAIAAPAAAESARPAESAPEAPAAAAPVQRAAEAAVPADTALPAPDAMEEMWLAVKINTEQRARSALLLKRADGRFLVSKADLDAWRLRLPQAAPTVYQDQDYYPLDALRGLSYEFDAPTQTLLVQAAPGLYGATNLQGIARGFVTPTPSSLGAFLNYDLFADHALQQTHVSGLLELGVFGPAGVGVSSFLGRSSNDSGESVIRLESTWTRDWPDRLASLRLGDLINRPGDWGRSVRLGGIQWATNFSTQPTFISFPLPGLAGEAALPSTVDLFVNDSLRLRKELPTGPFSIQDLPVVTGMGEARLVTTDILGRERIIIQPYYVSPRLLQQGLHDYSYEAGFIRENFGLESNDYGRMAVVGTHRLGITDRFTAEVHSELLRSQQTLGLSGAWLMPTVGVFTSSVAASRNENGAGGLLSLGFERQTTRYGFGGTTQLTSADFAQLGFEQDQPSPKQLSQAFVSWAAGRGSFALSYTHQDHREREDVELITGSYSTDFFGLGFLGISALKFLSGDKTSIIGLTFTRALDQGLTASANVSAQADSTVGSLQLQRNLPLGSGYGYRLGVGFGDSDRRTASVFAQNDIGTYALEAAQSMGETAYRASASGGIASLGKGVFLSRRINDSFAVVEVPDFPDVRIYADNQPVASTNAQGRALIPRLRPYQKNLIRIEQADLPMDAQIEAVELDVVPFFRSGVSASFPVTQKQHGLIEVIMENGKPIPVGAMAYLMPQQAEFPVGMHGEIYLTGLAASNRIRILWDQSSCDIDVPFTKSADPLPFLGSYTCPATKP